MDWLVNLLTNPFTLLGHSVFGHIIRRLKTSTPQYIRCSSIFLAKQDPIQKNLSLGLILNFGEYWTLAISAEKRSVSSDQRERGLFAAPNQAAVPEILMVAILFIPNDISTFVLTPTAHISSSGVLGLAARDMLEIYRTRAGLIVTTMLHCALPAIAMGIPVVVFYPLNTQSGRGSDLQRFSSLSDIVRVFEPSAANLVDWRGYRPDVGDIKLRLIDSFFGMAARWGALATPPIEGIAAASILPVPGPDDDYAYFNDPERLNRLAAAHAPDRLKWGAKSSYRAEWADRATLAARHIAGGERVLEIGAGTGSFRDLVAHRCQYTGADLQPVDPQFLTLDLETDALPGGSWNAVVLLGVLEYIFEPQAALSKVLAGADKVILSYCCVRPGDFVSTRRSRGWVSDLDQAELTRLVDRAGYEIAEITPVNGAEDFEQSIFLISLGAIS